MIENNFLFEFFRFSETHWWFDATKKSLYTWNALSMKSYFIVRKTFMVRIANTDLWTAVEKNAKQ